MYTHTHLTSQATPTPVRVLYVKRGTGPQKLIFMKHVQWVEYEPSRNALRVKLAGTKDNVVDEFIPDPRTDDPTIAKRIFYDIVRDVRSDGKLIEW